ncbi:glycine/betaine ABC transporter substrate-binding protein [Aeromicrobium sp. A1-2]|uniref:glycine betaine ABC transporter substrate-binding protein n=1 Tax=Aeromicrobium sp. A1-2 TaxID=2107713 RepID=UPI000E5309FC|nr:glycine betaine ABC transporter substrate-binding protein [Aeromicrobium sp. A1-2]AXT85316.1 glycine/betaine ABC transporter substrate-binding protein [Aeromicrobium sp. A1-2]
MKTLRRKTSMIAGAAAIALTLGACGLGGGDGGGSSTEVEAGSVDPDALKGVSLAVGSKEFDEQLLLGQLTIQMLKAAGADVSDKTNIQGSTATRNALTSGKTDIYWDYNGTGWINYLGHDDPIQDPVEQFEAVKKEDLEKNGLVWGAPAPFNNTYAFATTTEFAAENNIETHSDMADYVNKNDDATVCVESEFAGRPDGYPGFAKAYDMDVKDKTQTLGTGVIYTQVDKGGCDFGEIFTTDGRIAALDLKPLVDDEAFFPLYNGAVVLREDTATEFPAILEVMAPLSATLTTETMAELNSKVSAEGLRPSKVAEDFLKSEGFIK